MINFTEQDFINKTETLPMELRKKILLLSYDNSFIQIVNYKTVKSSEIISTVDYATQVTALGFASKQEMFEIILNTIGDEEEAKYIFKEIDRTVLVPNNLQGASEVSTTQTPTHQQEIVPTAVAATTNAPTTETHETAEDILKEIENPTPAPSSTPVFTLPPTTNATNPTTPPTLYPQQTINPNIESIQTPPTTTTPINTQTQTTPSSNPTSTVMPTKESILDSKLKEPSAQPLQSTYYKVDPYREQTK